MAAAPTFCSEYSAFVEGVVKGARKFLENKTAGTPFSLPDLPVKNHAASGDYNLRRIGLLARLIDRMIFDEIIVLIPKSTPTSRDHYLFHGNFDSEAGFGKLTGTVWIKAFWNRPEFDQAASDAMTSIERFLNHEVISQEISNVKIKTEMMSSQVRPTTPVAGQHKRPRANSNVSDSSSGSEPSSPVPLFSSVRGPASNHSASSPPDLGEREKESFTYTPSIPKLPSTENNPQGNEKEKTKLPSVSHAGPVSAPRFVNMAEAQVSPVPMPEVPTFVLRGLEDLRNKFPDDIFNETVDNEGLAYVRCGDCPERLFKVHYTNQDVSTFEFHLLGARHIEKVHDRMLERCAPLTITPAVKARVAKLKTKMSALTIYKKLSTFSMYETGTTSDSPLPTSMLISGASSHSASSPSDLEETETASFTDTPSIPKSARLETTPQEVAKSLLIARAASSGPTATSGIEAVPAAPVPDRKSRDFHFWLLQVSRLKREYPDDLLQVIGTPAARGAFHIKCHSCKGQVIKVSGPDLSNIDQHIQGAKHIENVFNQVRDGGNYLQETPKVKARIEALRTRLAHPGLYLRLTSFPYDQSHSGSSGRTSPSAPAHSESRSSIESGGDFLMNGKEIERNRQASLSNVDLRASPSVAPQDDLAESFEQKIPGFVSPALAQLRTRFPDDSFETDVKNPGMPRTKCNDCPDKYFEINIRDRTISTLKAHLLDSKHISNVHKRMNEQGKAHTITSDVTRRMEKLRRQHTTVALYDDLIRTGAPRGHRSPDPAQNLGLVSVASRKPSIPSSISSDSASPSPVNETLAQSQFEPPAHASKQPAKRLASAPIADDVATKRVCTGFDDNTSQTASRSQAEPSTAGPAPKEFVKGGFLPIIEKCVAKLEIHNGKFSDHSQKLKEQGDQVQQTMQMLGDIFDTGAAQNTALERMRTDTTEWIKDLEKNNTKQKATIDRLRLDVRQQKDIHAEFVRSTEARFERMAQDHKAQLGLVMDLIKSGDKAKIAKELGIP